MNNLVYKFDHLVHFTNYDMSVNSKLYRTTGLIKRTSDRIHYEFDIDEFKMCLMNILFLSKYSKDNDIILYIGCGENYHIDILCELFPTLEFHLWDIKFIAKYNNKNIKMFEKKIELSDIELYKSKNVLLITDLRPLDYIYKDNRTNCKSFAFNSMDYQMKWIKILNPKFMSLRLNIGKDELEHINGVIYLSPFSKIKLDIRIFSKNDDIDSLRIYDKQEIENKLNYFNFYIRPSLITDSKWVSLYTNYNFKNIWDNNIAFYVLDKYLKSKKDHFDNETIAKLYIHIYKFLKGKYIDLYVTFKKLDKIYNFDIIFGPNI